MVLLSEEKTGVFESLTVECVCVLEDLADTLYVDVLGQDLLALLLERGHVEAISKLKKVKVKISIILLKTAQD